MPGARHRAGSLRGHRPALPRRTAGLEGYLRAGGSGAMSRTKIIVAGLIASARMGLLSWQLHRERLVNACLSTGGAWDGASCGPARLRPILRRDLQRS